MLRGPVYGRWLLPWQIVPRVLYVHVRSLIVRAEETATRRAENSYEVCIVALRGIHHTFHLNLVCVHNGLIDLFSSALLPQLKKYRKVPGRPPELLSVFRTSIYDESLPQRDPLQDR